MLEFEVKNQKIKRTDNFEVVADSRNYLKAHFTFSDEWIGDITAIFGVGDEYYCVILEDGECIVPWEVIKPYGFSVSVVCDDRITADYTIVKVEKSGFTEGGTPKAPTPDVYNQIINSVKAPYIGENGNWFVWDSQMKTFVDTGVFATGPEGPRGIQGTPGVRGEKGETGAVGADGYTPQRGIDYWTDEDKTEIKGYVDEAILGGAW